MRLLLGHDESVAAFVASLIPHCQQGFGECRAMGVVDDDGRLVGGMVYHNWSPEHGTMEMSGASVSRRWLTRPIVKALFSYPFEAGCQMIVMQNSEHQKRLHRQLRALGFRSHPIPRLFGRNEGGVIFTLTAEDWSAGKFGADNGFTNKHEEAA